MPRVLTPADVEDFRDRLCDIAERRFAEEGLGAVTLRQLASELGVSPMTPYRYFKDKDAILAAVRARAFSRFALALEQADVETRDVGGAYLRFAVEHPAAYRLMFDIDQPTALEHPDLVEAMTRARATMTLHLQRLAAQGRFKGDVALVGHAYWAALHGAIMLHLSGLLEEPVGLERLVGELIGGLDHRYGIAAGDA